MCSAVFSSVPLPYERCQLEPINNEVYSAILMHVLCNTPRNIALKLGPISATALVHAGHCVVTSKQHYTDNI